MTPEKIQLDFWNVGQGDASTITWPNGKITIIDCGPKKSPLVNFIIRERPFINNIFITHNDSDHIGGLYSIVKQQIRVRIDDKLSRMKNLQDDDNEDVVDDLIGYLILLKIAMKPEVESVVVCQENG